MKGKTGGRRLTYANVMSTIAVFGVIGGGGAWAAGKIGAGDIKQSAVRSGHIKNGEVSGADLGRGAIPFGGRGSFRSANEVGLTGTKETVLRLPGIGSVVAECAETTHTGVSAYIRNRSGKTLVAHVVRGLPALLDAHGQRTEIPDGTDGFVASGATSQPMTSSWVTVSPAGPAAGPQAMLALTAEQGCANGKVTALAVSTSR